MSIVTDLSVNKKWKLRQGDDNEFTISFVDSLSAAFDVSNYVFSLNITDFNNKGVNILQLTEGSGIVNGGASGVVTFSITAAQSVLLENSYYYEIDAVFPDTTNHVLFQGKAIVNDYEYTGSVSTGVTANISLSGSDVTANITIGGGSSVTVVDDLTTGGSEAALSANQGVVLKGLIDDIDEGVWVEDLTTLDVSSIQNTVTSDISAQTGSNTFTGYDHDITTVGRTSTGDVDFFYFKKDGSEVFKVDVDGYTHSDRLYLAPTGYLYDNSGNFSYIYSGSTQLQVNSGGIGPAIGNGPEILREVSTNNNPTLIPNQGSKISGLGGNTGESSLITNSIEGLTVDSSQNVSIPNGTLTVSSDTNSTTILGRGTISSPISDIMFLSHVDNATSGAYAVRQNSSGASRFNSNAGQTSAFTIGSVSKFTVSSTALTMSTGIDLNLSSSSEIQFGGISHIEGDGTGNVSVPNGDLTISGGVIYSDSYTVATLPSAGTAGGQIFVSDETGGAVMAFSDGTNWRRFTDRAIVS